MSGGREPVHATFWLLEAPDSLSAAEPPRARRDGPGLLRRRRPPGRLQAGRSPPSEDREFAREAQEVHSRTFVAHVRYASTGALSERNTHPFEQDGRLFAHNGVIEGLDRLEAELGDAMSLVQRRDRLRALLRPHHPRDAAHRRRRRGHHRGGALGGREPAAVRHQPRAHLGPGAVGAALPRQPRPARARARRGRRRRQRAPGALQPARAHPRALGRPRRPARGGRRHRADGRRPGWRRWPPASCCTSTPICA